MSVNELGREILFRAKTVQNIVGEKAGSLWVYGCFHKQVINNETINWITNDEFDYVVDSKTVGQFTGFFDKNGTKIFEGDIVKSNREVQGIKLKHIGTVVFNNYSCAFSVANQYKFGSEWNGSTSLLNSIIQSKDDNFEIIGNIYDTKI